MQNPPRFRSAFVPHDLPRPLAGSGNGPLAGLTAAVKDMYDIAGQKVGSGSPDWLKARTPATETAGVVKKILAAGATVIGKTICDEFFFSVTGANAHYGTPVNPRAIGRLPGGSSSGSASAVASGACDFALGSDTGGSIRIPASFCGVYGLRPTHGRIDLSGVQAMAPSFDVPGWFSSGPGVFRTVGRVVLERQGAPAKIEQLIVLEDAFAEADPEVAALLRSALDIMRDRLPRPEHDKLAPKGLDAWREAFRTLQGREVWQTFGTFVEQYKPKMGPGIRERIEFSATVTERDVEGAARVREEARAHIRSVAAPGTILVLPSAPCVAPLAGLSAQELESFRVRVMRLTCISGLSGLPQVSIPVGTVFGFPVGLSFIGWAGGDEALLDLAYDLSKYCGMEA